MNRALYVAKTGLEAQDFRLATISNNLSNANTFGYKAGRAEFDDLMYQNVRQPGASATQNDDNTLPSGLQLGTGVKAVGVQKLHTQGNAMVTDNQLDVMIEGRGFFQALDQDGNIRYTRDGSFEMNQNGDLVTSSGYLVEPNINIPLNSTEVFIGSDGTVSYKEPGNPEPVDAGQLELATFVNQSGLEAMGKNFYAETLASGPPNIKAPETEEAGSLLQGALESSNVNTVDELIGMIEAQRTYEMNSKAISAADGMMQYLNNNV
ncbi:flagellar basal-body rod protein FlgG [Hydrogenovibrio halophilus]|uniref:flagellar basal-body rod protein FlgG n=1 Tax=Hydrogenovibrio halophilus TaxID=373391 RepID=UPI0003763C78|nr:flagellar basal-body rod protein FlgG [Hydrogenovibrio halophilus]